MRIAIFFVMLCVSIANAGSPDWPQWRGAGRDGISGEKQIVDRWPEEGPRVVWRRSAGEGFSGVSVSGKRLYTLWDESGGQFLVALDTRTGAEAWRLRLGRSFTNHYGNGPRSTPAVLDGVVYAVGTAGGLFAVDAASGEPVWQHDLVREYGAEMPSYGYASSPLVTGDTLILEVGATEATFMAFHRKTGRVVWSSQKDAPAYSSPIEVSIDGRGQVIFWSAHGLHAVSPSDGTLLWSYVWESFCPVSGDPLNTGTPIFVAPDGVFISSGSGAALVRVSATDDGYGVETAWKTREMRSDVNTAVLLGSYIYGFDRGILQCLDVRTGEVRWQARGFQRGSLIAADGKLLVLGENGNLAIVEADPEGFVQLDSAQVLEGRNWTSPSLARGKLYLRNQQELVCLDVKE